MMRWICKINMGEIEMAVLENGIFNTAKESPHVPTSVISCNSIVELRWYWCRHLAKISIVCFIEHFMFQVNVKLIVTSYEWYMWGDMLWDTCSKFILST